MRSRSAAPSLLSFRPGGSELRRLVSLALPVAVVQVGIVFQGVVDTAMVGRVSAPDLAAVALGNLYFFGISVFGLGLLLALDPIVSQAFGAEDEDGIEVAVQRGLVLALVLALLTSMALAMAGPVLNALRQPEEVVPLAAGYARALIAGMLPFYGFIVFRQSLQAVGRVAPVVWIVVLANLLNAFANWVLVFGNLGAPAMGAIGSGWATAISRWFMWIGALGLAWPSLSPYLRRVRRDVLERRPLFGMVRVGAPIGIHLGLEFGAFGTIGILMGWLGAEAMAGHQIAVNLAALTFMVPVGIAQAGAVLVGKSVGAEDPERARRFAGAALMVGCLTMSVSASVFLGLPEQLSVQFTDMAAVIAVAAALLPIAGVFQLFDGIQVVCAGVLRGVADTLRPLMYNLLGFWLVGMPVSLWFGFGQGMGPAGLWWGLAAGLGAVAILLLIRVWNRLRGPLVRVSFGSATPSDGPLGRGPSES